MLSTVLRRGKSLRIIRGQFQAVADAIISQFPVNSDGFSIKTKRAGTKYWSRQTKKKAPPASSRKGPDKYPLDC